MVSYYQPKLSPYASWNADGINFAQSTTFGGNPSGIFITVNGTIYMADGGGDKIYIWSTNSSVPTRIMSGNFLNPFSIFVMINGDIFFDYNLAGNKLVAKWTPDANMSTVVMSVPTACQGLFVDINNTIYCSMPNSNRVVKKSLNDSSNITTVAGTGSSGSSASMLSFPYGVFVDTNFDLYVADYSNNRIQLFSIGQLNGTTVAGNESINVTIALYRPTSVILDGDGYLFIVDNGNQRIVGSGPNGFRCVVGCPAGGGIMNQLSNPCALSFDSFGNIYVTDWGTHHIHKFVIMQSPSKSLNVYISFRHFKDREIV